MEFCNLVLGIFGIELQTNTYGALRTPGGILPTWAPNAANLTP